MKSRFSENSGLSPSPQSFAVMPDRAGNLYVYLLPHSSARGTRSRHVDSRRMISNAGISYLPGFPRTITDHHLSISKRRFSLPDATGFGILHQGKSVSPALPCLTNSLTDPYFPPCFLQLLLFPLHSQGPDRPDSQDYSTLYSSKKPEVQIHPYCRRCRFHNPFTLTSASRLSISSP